MSKREREGRLIGLLVCPAIITVTNRASSVPLTRSCQVGVMRACLWVGSSVRTEYSGCHEFLVIYRESFGAEVPNACNMIGS